MGRVGLRSEIEKKKNAEVLFVKWLNYASEIKIGKEKRRKSI